MTRPRARIALAGAAGAGVLAAGAALAGAQAGGTDLRVDAPTTLRSDGKTAIHVVVANAGAVTAQAPRLSVTTRTGVAVAPIDPRECSTAAVAEPQPVAGVICVLPPIAPRQVRRVTLVGFSGKAARARLEVTAEVPDTHPDDNVRLVRIAALPPFTVTAPRRQRLGPAGLLARVHALGPGRVRVSAQVQLRRRAVHFHRTTSVPVGTTRAVHVRPRGATLRAIRAALRHGELPATITVRPAALGTSDSVALVVTG